MSPPAEEIQQAISFTNREVVSAAAEISAAQADQSMAHAASLAMLNAVALQQQMGILRNAVISQCVSLLLSLSGSQGKADEKPAKDTTLQAIQDLKTAAAAAQQSMAQLSPAPPERASSFAVGEQKSAAANVAYAEVAQSMALAVQDAVDQVRAMSIIGSAVTATGFAATLSSGASPAGQAGKELAALAQEVVAASIQNLNAIRTQAESVLNIVRPAALPERKE